MGLTDVTLCGKTLCSPVIAASGTFGFGGEYAGIVDMKKPVSYTHLDVYKRQVFGLLAALFLLLLVRMFHVLRESKTPL